MKELMANWPKLARKIKGRPLTLLLDFDGTLSRLRNHPDKAVLPRTTKALLEKLAARPGVVLGFISGRDLEVLKEKLGIKKAVYSGGHGCRIKGLGLDFSAKTAPKTQRALRDFHTKLAAATSGIPGVLIENKAFTVGLHYWQVRPSRRPELLVIFENLLKKYSGVYAKHGKFIVEVAPLSSWNKGDAVSYILKKTTRKGQNTFPIYIGDDVTDEDAFRALRGKGLAIKVGGHKNSAAPYFLRDTVAVRAFLRFLLNP